MLINTNMKKYGIIKFLDGDFDLDVNMLLLQNTIWETQNHIANFLKNLVIQLLNILIIFFSKENYLDGGKIKSTKKGKITFTILGNIL